MRLVSEESFGKAHRGGCIGYETWKCIERDQRALLVETRTRAEAWWPERKAQEGSEPLPSKFLGNVLPYHAEPFVERCRDISVDSASGVSALLLPDPFRPVGLLEGMF